MQSGKDLVFESEGPACDVIIGVDGSDCRNAADIAERYGLIKPLASMVKRLLVQTWSNRDEIDRMIGGAIFGPPCKVVLSDATSGRLSNREWLVLCSAVRGAVVFRLSPTGYEELRFENDKPVTVCTVRTEWSPDLEWIVPRRASVAYSDDSPARTQAPILMAIGPGPLPEHIRERMRDYDPANMWRWEKWDFANRKIHLSCPVCYRLTIADLQLVIDCVKIRDAHSDCTFEGFVAHDDKGAAELEAWRAGNIGVPLARSVTAATIEEVGYSNARADKIILDATAALCRAPRREDCLEHGMYRPLIDPGQVDGILTYHREQAQAAALDDFRRSFLGACRRDALLRTEGRPEMLWDIVREAMAAVKVRVVAMTVKDGELQATLQEDASRAIDSLKRFDVTVQGNPFRKLTY